MNNVSIKRILGIIIACLMSCHIGWTQVWMHSHYTTKDGLPHANVFRITQDSEGYIWMATDAGLSRYNSRVFENYFVEDGLSDNCIMSLAEGAEKKQYICTYFNGVSVKENDTIHKLYTRYGKIPDKTLFTYPQKESLWLIAKDTLQSLFLIRNDSIRKIICQDEAGNRLLFFNGFNTSFGLLFATNSGIFSIDKFNRIVAFHHDKIKERVFSITNGKNGTLWVATATLLLHLDSNKILEKIPLTPSMSVSDILVSQDNMIWVAIVGKGIYTVNNGQLVSIQSKLGLNTTIVNDLFEDKEGNIWIATHGEGVFKISNRQISRYPIKKQTLNVYCTSLTTWKKHIVSSSVGILSILKNEELTLIPTSLLQPSNYVYFAKVHHDVVYIGTAFGLIQKNLLPPFDEKIIKLKNGTAIGCISIYCDKSDAVWVGGYSGLYRLQNGALHTISISTDKTYKRINTITESASGKLWMGTENSIIAYDGKHFSEIALHYDGRTARVLSLLEDNNGRLWIGTNNGLAYYDHEAIHFVGQRHLVIKAIAADKTGRIWLGSDKGVKYSGSSTDIWYDYYKGKIKEDVLCLLTTDSCLYAGTTAGILSIVHPMQMAADTQKLPIYITTAFSDNRLFSHPKKVTLPYNNQKLSIHYIALNYKDPEHTVYRYKIVPLDNDWQETNNTSIDLAGMAPGQYTFILNCKRYGGDWQQNQILEIYVTTPFWMRWWFITITGILLLSGALFIGKAVFSKREKRKRQKLELENKVIHLKQQALHALINPHFIFNCMNAIQHYINEHEHETANEYLSQFSRLIRMTMEHATASFILLEREIERIQLYVGLEQLRFGEELAFNLDVQEGMETTKLWIPNMILQPYVENAIWHGIMPKDGVGLIALSIHQPTAHQIKITIRDNGIGFNALKISSDKKSMGMKLIRERLSLLQGLLNMDFKVSIQAGSYLGKPSGTVVEIIIPVINQEITI